MVEATIKPASLKQRIFGASAWTLGRFMIGYVIRLGSNLVMTRLLVPDMFGVMAIAMMVITGLAMMSDLGLQQNIIQSNRGGQPEFLNTAWTIQIIRGVVLWFFGLFVSLALYSANARGLVSAASVYADPRLPYIIAAISLSVLMDGFQSTKVAEASRLLVLGRITQIQLLGQIVGLVCMLSWVALDRTIWALVAGSLSATAATTLLGHIWLPGHRNRLHWDKAACFEIFHFGKWIFLSSVLGFFANNSDRILLGVYVGSGTLGIYSIAFMMVNAVGQILRALIANVSYAAMSEVSREQFENFRRNLYRFHMVTASFAYFCAGLLIASGHVLIELLYDPRYHSAGWMLQILAAGLIAVPFNLAQWSMLARGLPRIFTNVIAVKVAAAVVSIPIGFQIFGLTGALCGIVASQLIGALTTIYFQARLGLFDALKELLIFSVVLLGIFVGMIFNATFGF